jgi:uncharacterized damage-inducible protein DinB
MDQTGNRETVLARYKEGPALLDRALDGLRDSVLDARPSRGGWNIRQIVHHTVDGDDLWKACIKAIREHVLQLIEQVPNAWSRTIGVRTASGGVETVSVGFVLEMQADHLEHHVNRILAIKHELGGA